jgi:hypothetical protein
MTQAIFAVALIGIVPLAGMLGYGTEAIALWVYAPFTLLVVAEISFRYTGDALGGLINASLGNATEFIIVRSLGGCKSAHALITTLGYPPARKMPDSCRAGQSARRPALQVRVLQLNPRCL